MGKRTRKSAKKQPSKVGGPGVGAMIAVRRRQMGWTLARLAEEAECARSYLWMIERGQRAAPGVDVLTRIERALGFGKGELLAAARWEGMPVQVRERVDELRGKERIATRLAEILGGSGIRKDGKVAGALDAAHRSGELRRLVEELGGEEHKEERASVRTNRARMLPPPNPLPQGGGEIPLINSVAAGYPREFTDLGYPARVADDYVRVPGLDDPDAFACRVVGDSMMPEYREGDIVVFSPAKSIKSGQDCLARLEPDHETTFKRVYLERDKRGREMIRLQPLNPKYPAKVFAREDVAGLFAAVSVTRVV